MTPAPPPADPAPPAPDYAELCVTSNFTFLTGASHPHELMKRATELGLKAIAITDRNSLAGVVRAWRGLRGIAADPDRPEGLELPRLITGARLVLRDCPVEWLALPTDRAAYARLSRLLTQGKRRAGKAECHLTLADLEQGCAGMILIALPPADLAQALGPVQTLQRHFPRHVFLGAAPRYDGSDQAWLNACAGLALRASAPMVAVGDVLMHRAHRRPLADVLTCMRHRITIDRIGTQALMNAERRLKSAAEMARIFHHHPAAIRRTLEIAARCSFNLAELRGEYPDEVVNGEPAQARLERLVAEGLARRCTNGITDRHRELAAK